MIYEDLISMFDILYTRLKSPKVQGRDLVRLGTTGAMAPADIFQNVVNTHSNTRTSQGMDGALPH